MEIEVEQEQEKGIDVEERLDLDREVTGHVPEVAGRRPHRT